MIRQCLGGMIVLLRKVGTIDEVEFPISACRLHRLGDNTQQLLASTLHDSKIIDMVKMGHD